MSGLTDTPEAAPNVPEYSVSEISGAIRKTIEGAFGHVRVRGEVGRVSRPASGHLYLDLKDDRAVLSAVVWKGVAARLATRPEEGMEVIATGRLTTFGGQSRYQLVIESIAPAGIGALMAMLEKRKAALAGEGLFDAAQKRPLPFLPDVVGVITSPSGAVIRDILHRLRDRFPRRVILWPVTVQGERCAPEVAAAIVGMNRLVAGGAIPRPDVLIVARGGGSVEDLWGFNEEIVVRAAAASEIPLISAVGHETDTTLIDHAADRRAPTPTAAAEMAVPVRSDLLTRVRELDARRQKGLRGGLDLRRRRTRELGRSLPRLGDLVAMQRQRMDLAASRLGAALGGLVSARRAAFLRAASGLRPSALRLQAGRQRDRFCGVTRRFKVALDQHARRDRLRLDRLGTFLSPAILRRRRDEKKAVTDKLAGDLSRNIRASLTSRRTRFEALSRIAASIGYKETLARGYAVIRGGGGNVITKSESARRADLLAIEMADGTVTAKPVDPAPKQTKPRAKKPRDPQGSLF